MTNKSTFKIHQPLTERRLLMSKKNKKSRAGGKYAGTHCTIIPAAGIVTDIAHEQPEVSKIIIGFIKAGLRPVTEKKVKILDKKQNVVMLKIRDNTSHQEVIVHTEDAQTTKLTIARGARNVGMHISFGKKT